LYQGELAGGLTVCERHIFQSLHHLILHCYCPFLIVSDEEVQIARFIETSDRKATIEFYEHRSVLGLGAV
jgi:Zn-finger protein